MTRVQQGGQGQAWLWLAALIAGTSFMLPVVLDWNGPAIIAWKGAGVGLLALWAATQAAGRDGWLITMVMALGALGDVLLDAVGLETGAMAFAAGHLLAILLYLRNRRPALTPSQTLLGWLVVPATVVITWALVRGEDGAATAILYSGFLAVMAAMAWTSRFPRYRTGIGAMLFVASDLFIFARASGAIDPMLGRLLIWPLYFAGQALIVRGVVATLADDRGFRHRL